MLRRNTYRAEIAFAVIAVAAFAQLGAARGGEAAIDSHVDPYLDAPGDAATWSAASMEATPSVISSPWDFDAALDGGVMLAQAQTRPPMPAIQQQRVSTALRRPGLRGAALGTLASVPYMIGDTGSGTCLGFSGLLDVGLAHPTLACSRLNVAEANSALPADRLYYSYRHFEDATPISVYQFETELDVDRHLIAYERTYWDGLCSLEVRLPLEQRLTSDFFSIVTPNLGRVDLVDADSERRTELGNVSLIFKSLLVARETFALSGGLGVTLPTAQDVNWRLAVSGFVEFPNEPDVVVDTDTTFQAVFSNESVYLLPFMAWIYAPSTRWYHQGFLQFETEANPSHVTANGFGVNTLLDNNNVPIGFFDYLTGPQGGLPFPVPVREQLFSQTLMRLNLGGGYALWEGAPQNRYPNAPPNRLLGLLEFHYTTTLNDANLTPLPLNVASFNFSPSQEILIGNVNNRTDILNVATGASLQVNQWIFNGGVIVPMRDCPDCGFDIEYNAQVQRLF